ncbi:MAG: M20/M25/M40 family metallo-hydrolase, partial [Bacteroidetes bacterium]|nr:M20/M25/M40 family metallo-hydrolase [Bacteroidota bacterium]
LQSETLKCDPFGKVNLEGKIVFLLSGFAGIDDPESENYKILKSDRTRSFRQIERDKVENVRKAGAMAIVRYDPHRSFKAANPSNLPMFHDNEYYEGDEKMDDFYLKEIRLPNWKEKEELPVVEIDRSLAESILNKSENLLSSMLDPGYKMSSFKSVDLPETLFHLTTKKEQEVIRARNVLAYIEGENPDEVIVIGGHYDHVGRYNGFTFNGADDNVSGTVGMLSLARAFMETGIKPAKTIVFAAWTGEEQGLWGSKYFVKNIPDDLNIILNINLDMISRTSVKDSTENYLSLLYTKGHEEFEQIFRAIKDEYKFKLDIDYRSAKQPRGGSDFASFAMEGIPVISLFTGLHKDYHMPNDEIEFMNLEKMVAIIKLTYIGLNEILD